MELKNSTEIIQRKFCLSKEDYIKGQKAQENMRNTVNHQRNSIQNHSEKSFHPSYNGYFHKDKSNKR